jgi:hypothetical protein
LSIRKSVVSGYASLERKLNQNFISSGYINNSNVTLNRFADYIIVAGYIDANGQIPENWTSTSAIAEGYRPDRTYYDSNYTGKRVNFNTNGTITFVDGTSNNEQFRFNCIWRTADAWPS